jgi:type IV secretion system protein VirB10
MPPELETPEKLEPAALPGPVPQPVLQHQQTVSVATKPTEDPDAAARRKQLAQEREAALKSGLFANRQSQASASSNAEGQGSLFDGAAEEGPSPAAVADQRALTPVDQNLQGDKRRFATTQASDGVYVQKPYLRPLSPYEIKAGTIIPGALVTGLNSDLPGEIIGRITESVYDTVSGRHVLIPQGTTVVGRYNSFVAYGQDRAQIVWDRLIMPNGRSIELEGMRGADKAGASGLEDEVDHHWGRIIGAVVLSTGISVVSNIATDDSRDGSLSDELGSAVAQESAQVGSDFVRRNSNIQPTIKVRPGWPFTIIVHKDLILDPAS